MRENANVNKGSDRMSAALVFTSSAAVAAPSERSIPHISILPRAIQFNWAYAAVDHRDVRLVLLRRLAIFAMTVNHLDHETREHSMRVARIAVELSQSLSQDAGLVDMIWIAALLHDLGKAPMAPSILAKPQPLSKNERGVLKQHPSIGAQLLMFYKYPSPVINMVHYHHERIDGGGYPFGLRGEQIPFAARVIAVADAFDTMTSTRPYRQSVEVDRALDEIVACAGSQFDPFIARSFANMLTDRTIQPTARTYSSMHRR